MVYTDINVTTINGRLTKDATYKQIKDDFGEVSFTICSNTLTKKDGQWAAKPNFIFVKQKGKNLSNFCAALTKVNRFLLQALSSRTHGRRTDRTTLSLLYLQKKYSLWVVVVNLKALLLQLMKKDSQKITSLKIYRSNLKKH